MPCSEEDEETQLIVRIRAGECEAFRHLVESHQDRVYRVCLHLLGEHARAEDLTQESFVTAFRKLHQFDPGKGRFSTWLLTIARRLCLNARQKTRPLSLAEPPERPTASSEHPDRQATRTDVFRALDDAFVNLSESHRRAFVFAEIEELSHQEIAHLEDVAIGTVKSRVSRAKEMLRSSLRTTYQELKENAP